jgi:hypothetical protein
VIAALAGRRIDAPGTTSPRFPVARIESVQSRIRQCLEAGGVRVLVCAAACGADLVALSAASELGLRRRLVLPVAVELFRERSVVDRPGPHPWGALYDRFVREARATNDLIVLDLAVDDPKIYEAANEAILDGALALAAQEDDESEALVVWDGPHGAAVDYSAHFAREAERRRMSVKDLGILSAGKPWPSREKA